MADRSWNYDSDFYSTFTIGKVGFVSRFWTKPTAKIFGAHSPPTHPTYVHQIENYGKITKYFRCSVSYTRAFRFGGRSPSIRERSLWLKSVFKRKLLFACRLSTTSTWVHRVLHPGDSLLQWGDGGGSHRDPHPWGW